MSLFLSAARPKLLAWAERYLTQAAAVLPEQYAEGYLSEWRAEVHIICQERGALKAVLWARGTLEAAPAIRAGERGRQVAIKSFVLQFVRTGHVLLALMTLTIFLGTELALVTGDSVALDSVGVSVALSLWILAEIGGTALAFVFLPRTAVRPFWLARRSRRSMLALGTIGVALGIGAGGLAQEMLSHPVEASWLPFGVESGVFLTLVAASALDRPAAAGRGAWGFQRAAARQASLWCWAAVALGCAALGWVALGWAAALSVVAVAATLGGSTPLSRRSRSAFTAISPNRT